MTAPCILIGLFSVLYTEGNICASSWVREDCSLKLSYFSPFFHTPGADKDQPFLQRTPRCNNSIYNKNRVESSSKAFYTISNKNEWIGHSSLATWKPNVYAIWKKSAGNMNGITSKRLNLWKMNTQAAAFLNNSRYAIFFVV